MPTTSRKRLLEEEDDTRGEQGADDTPAIARGGRYASLLDAARGTEGPSAVAPQEAPHSSPVALPFALGTNKRVFGVPRAIYDERFPFVNRYAETLDIFAPQVVCCGGLVTVSLAYQLMGSGKTALGIHAVSVLRRPRESSAAEEDHVAERLMSSRVMSDLPPERRESIMAKARARSEEESLVARVLREYHSNEGGDPSLIDAIKDAVTIYVDLRMALNGSHANLSSFMSAAIFDAVGLPDAPSNVMMACRTVSRFIEGRDVFLVIDEIGMLFEYGCRHLLPPDSLHGDINKAAMLELRRVIDVVCLSLKDKSQWRVYCTGRTEWLAMYALAEKMSPLRAEPVLLASLHSQDVLEIIERTSGFQQFTWSQEVKEQVATEIASRSGGVGRVIYYALLALLRRTDRIHDADKLMDAIEVDILAKKQIPGLFPTASGTPTDVNDPALLSYLGCMLLRGSTFAEDATVSCSGGSVLISSALTALGFNFVPAPGEEGGPLKLLPVAGLWQLRALPDALFLADGSEALQLLRLMRWTEKGTGRGPIFESLCIVQTEKLIRISVQEGKRKKMRKILPFLRDTSAGSATMGKLQLRMLPKFSSVRRDPLTDQEKASILKGSFIGTINPVDLRWYLYNVLQEDELGVPRGQSACQDWFIRARGAVIGFSNKMVDGLRRRDVTNELPKRPILEEGDDPYVLVTLTSALGPELAALMGDRRAMLLSDLAPDLAVDSEPTTTEIQTEASSSTAPRSESSSIPSSDVVIVSPTHAKGLDSLLTPAVGEQLRSLDSGADYTGIMGNWISVRLAANI